MVQNLVEDKNLKVLADLVYINSGIVFKESNLTVLQSRLSSKLKEKSMVVLDYLQLLQKDKNELLSFIDFVTTNFTSFFRNPKHFELLNDELLPKIIERNGDSKIVKMWSAACASGEEPYTMAMVTFEYFNRNHLFDSGWTFHITCSDISLESLFTAKEGKYPKKSVEKIDPAYLDKFFTQIEGQYLIKNELKKFVQFDYHNLIYDNGIRDIDISFCRNVLIYFDEGIQKKVVMNIYEAMKPQSFLVIGHSESLIGLFDGFKLSSTEKGIVYVRQ